MTRSAAILLLASPFIMRGEVASDSLKSRQLDEVVVTGSNAAVGRNLLPYTVTAVGATQLEATGSTRLLTAVSGLVPSLFVTERNIFGFGVSGGGAGHIKMRGVGGDRASAVLMMVDGQPQFAGLYSHHVADFYCTDYVDRVEVLRGPASVLYGSNAMAGVINVITRSPKTGGVHASFTSQYGSHRTWLNTLSGSLRRGRLSALLSADYSRTDGVRRDFDFGQSSVYAKAGYEMSNQWTATADYSFMTFTSHDPVYPQLKGEEGVYHQKVIRGEASLMAANRYLSTDGAARLYYSYGNHFIHDPNYFHSLDDRLGVIVYQNFSIPTGTSATVGFDFDRYTGKIPVSGGKDHTQAPLATMTRRSITEYSPYVTAAQSILSRTLTIDAGLRMANSDRFGTRWIPQAGFVYSPVSVWSLKASVAKGYRNPSFRELYLYKFANPDLKPEEMTNYEVSVGFRPNPLLHVDLTAYYAKGSQLIQQTATQNENTGSFINKGIELSAKSRPVQSLNIWASYSYLHTSLANLTGAPKNQYYLGLGWDAFRGFHADAELKGTGGLYVADDMPHQNYVLLNLRLSYTVHPHLQLFVNIDNLTDTRYVINKGYPMPGITALAGFRLSL